MLLWDGDGSEPHVRVVVLVEEEGTLDVGAERNNDTLVVHLEHLGGHDSSRLHISM